MDAFWCITLGLIVLRLWWRHNIGDSKPKQKKIEPMTITNSPLDKALKEKQEADRKRERDIADLKRQGYTDELIATILPVINNGG